MGYYSEVAYVIEFKDKTQKETFINLQKVKADPLINEALRELQNITDHSDNKLAFHVSSAKWYDDFADVRVHHDFMVGAEELFPDDVNWLFVRIGEQDDDLQQETGGENAWDLSDYVYPVRYIKFELSGEPVLEEETEEANG
jgi:hypothetical protein